MRDPIIQTTPLGSRWRTADPFLFCVHHVDRYPKGNEHLGPDAPLTGHDIGQDFEGVDIDHCTQFGGWPFPEDAPVHPRDRGRFARHADGRVEDAGQPTSSSSAT